MLKKVNLLVMLFLSTVLIGSVFAATWSDGGSDHLWNTAANWSGGTVPGSGEDVFINTGVEGPIIDSTVAAEAAVIRLGGNGTTDNITIAGGSLNSGHLILGEGNGSDVTVDMSGGSLTIASLWAGNNGDGTFTMTGGTIVITGEQLYVSRFGTGQGYVYLDGGTITSPGVYMAGGLIDITGGTLILNGNVTGTISTYEGNGWITAYSGRGTIECDYNISNPGKTTVTANGDGLEKAWSPTPSDDAEDVPIDAVLSWLPGSGAINHDVYLGTNPGSLSLVSEDQTELSYNPGTLLYGKSYYWRIDEFDGVTTWEGDVWQFTTTNGKASNPSPNNGAEGVAIDAVLSWSPTPQALSQDVYFGTTNPPAFVQNQPGATYTPPGDLAMATTYYWRIDGVNGDDVWEGDVWSFTTDLGKAENPSPANGEGVMDSGDIILNWTAGSTATSHNVYLGTSFNEVNNAMPAAGDLNLDGEADMDDLSVLTGQWLTDPGSSNPSADIDGDGNVDMKDFTMLAEGWKRPTPYKGNQTGTEFTPTETIELGQMYYWRIDEVDGSNVWKGDVWSFYRDFIPQTVEELWSNFDPYAEPLEAQVYREWNENVSGVNTHFKLVRYVVKTWKGQKSIMAAYYAYPVGGTNLPTLLHLHGGGQSASGAGLYEIRNHVHRGYAVMSINWGGQDMGDVINTDWGAINPNFTAGSWQNLLPYPETIDTVESPRNCGWYPVTYSALRALTFLEAQPEVDPSRLGVFGHSMGGTLTTYVAGTGDSRVKAASPSVGGAGFRTYEAYDLGPATARYITGDLELFRRTMGTESYAPRIQCPILFLGATNDFNAKMDDVYRIFALIPPSVNQLLTFAPHLNHRFTPEHNICRALWFDQHLKGSFTFPEKPASTLSLTEADHIPLFEVTPDDSATILAVDLYYSQDKDAVARFWRDAQAVQQGNKWVANCPLTASGDSQFNYLFAYANVTYQIGGTVFAISSDLHVITDAMLSSAGILKTDPTSLLIDDFARGFHDWGQYGSESWTRKTTDPKWHGPLGAQLKLRFKTAATTNFTVTLKQNPWRFYRTPSATYSKTINVSGSPNWQDIILDMSDFPGLTRWDWIDELGINPTPELDELIWIEP